MVVPPLTIGESGASPFRPDQGAGKRVGVRDIESGRDGQEDPRSHQRPIILRDEGKDVGERECRSSRGRARRRRLRAPVSAVRIGELKA